MRVFPLDEKWAWFGAGLASAGVVFVAYVVWFGPANSPRLTVPPRPTPQPIAVHVVGEVITPGVYAVGSAARVSDVLELAGGATDEADVSQLNLAAHVADGQRIVVPRRPAASAGGSSDPSGAPLATGVAATARPRININVATFAELDALPGVGVTTAQKIVEQRQKVRFTSIDQLVELKIVTNATFQRIRDLITAE